ncbi:protein DMP2-like [Benincasa hispida]|uniref:protein DMP2-like n=1 Tax=Benincasa hispida TaxID=102211 RepID=UPI001901DD61|nr:protein DMP2-like [Benincasa hispida]
MATSQLNQKTLTGAGDLIKILPTGTVFLFQFLSPVLTNSGRCEPVNKVLVLILVILCGLSCYLSSFTDSYVGSDGTIQWTIVTPSGMWPMPPTSVSLDLSAYKLRLGDFVHATFSAAVFAILVVMDSNMMQCFFPSLGEQHKVLVQVLPPVVGAVSSVLFVTFPNTRHGIGYRSTSTTIGVQKATSTA